MSIWPTRGHLLFKWISFYFSTLGKILQVNKLACQLDLSFLLRKAKLTQFTCVLVQWSIYSDFFIENFSKTYPSLLSGVLHLFTIYVLLFISFFLHFFMICICNQTWHRAQGFFNLGPYAAFHGMAVTCHIEGSMMTAVWTHLRIFLNSKFHHFHV
jgi:hypothetical protein